MAARHSLEKKIVTAVAKEFVCADESKWVDSLGTFPLPVEVIPMARSHVARELVKLGGDPVWRDGVVTDNGNIILDVHHLYPMASACELEEKINHITGVVTNGLFALGAGLIFYFWQHRMVLLPILASLNDALIFAGCDLTDLIGAKNLTSPH